MNGKWQVQHARIAYGKANYNNNSKSICVSCGCGRVPSLGARLPLPFQFNSAWLRLSFILSFFFSSFFSFFCLSLRTAAEYSLSSSTSSTAQSIEFSHNRTSQRWNDLCIGSTLSERNQAIFNANIKYQQLHNEMARTSFFFSLRDRSKNYVNEQAANTHTNTGHPSRLMRPRSPRPRPLHAREPKTFANIKSSVARLNKNEMKNIR